MIHELEDAERPVEPKPPRDTELDDENVLDEERLPEVAIADRAGAAPSDVRGAGALAASEGTRTGELAGALSLRLTVCPEDVDHERQLLDEPELEELVDPVFWRGIKQPGICAGVTPGGHGAAPTCRGGSNACGVRWFER